MGIHRIEVARGIQWVEVPEAGLRILCGCPADAVKHLIKRGLIRPTEFKGVASETGPNAILLSDLSLQNGEFANLAEFPVLQMLYKQGLILPGHPNNVGSKPLLIGSAAQVDAQLRYIYRGNYGLVSREEMMETGVTAEQANELFRIKLKFAFGEIRPTRDFVDTRVVGDDSVELRGGVTLSRLSPNVFEFSHQGETMKVDLNLQIGETYEPAYALGYRRFEPGYFSVIHSGEGDGWDVHRPCMSSIITYQSRIYLIDAGPNLSNSMAALGISIDQVDGIFHTHAHDDHFAGLTTLMRAGKRIRYLATPLVRASATRKLAALMGIHERQFPDFFDIRDLVADEWNNVEGLEVMPVFSPHPVETTILFFRALWGDGYRSYGHLADIVSMDVLREMVTDNVEAPGLDKATFDRVRRSYLTPVDLKKVDIGGGLIHGCAKDFRADASKRILLAHRAGELTLEEKEIGSSAAFGTVDTLVNAQSAEMRHIAFGYLAAHLPGIPLHEMRLLLNHPITEINPGAIVLKEGETPSDVLLLVSGQVERIRTRDHVFGTMSAGSLLGVVCILEGRPSRHTYRSSSFLRVMRVPGDVYAEVIRRNGVLELVRRTATLRSFLEATPLFCEGLPPSALGRVVTEMKERSFKRGDTILGPDLEVLNLVRSGLIERVAGNNILDVLGERDFFGEEGAVFDVRYVSTLRVREDASVLQIPGDILRGVPSLRWRLLDTYQRRVARAVYAAGPGPVFIWHDTFSSQVVEIDARHQRMIALVNSILTHLNQDSHRDGLGVAFETLVDFARDHFTAEEALMARHDYPETRRHGSKHRELFRQLTEYQENIRRDGRLDRASFQYFFESWLVRHVWYEDREAGAFLSVKSAH